MLFDSEKCEQLHNRTISVSTWVYDDEAVAIEGRLTDDRFVETYSLFGESRPSGIVHDMVVRMIVRGPKLTIEAVEAEMLKVPDSNCPQAIDSLLPLKGERIASGFTVKVQQLAGGGKGCAHLVALCRAMASAAVQGAYALMARRAPEKRNLSMESLSTVIDTCHLWRSDGPMVQRLKKKLK